MRSYKNLLFLMFVNRRNSRPCRGGKTAGDAPRRKDAVFKTISRAQALRRAKKEGTPAQARLLVCESGFACWRIHIRRRRAHRFFAMVRVRKRFASSGSQTKHALEGTSLCGIPPGLSMVFAALFAKNRKKAKIYPKWRRKGGKFTNFCGKIFAKPLALR